MKIGVLTGGGDCPSLNAVLRAIVKSAIYEFGMEVTGFMDGFWGLIHNKVIPLDINKASGILAQGGTILGANNKCDPFRMPVGSNGDTRYENLSQQCVHNYRSHKLDALVVIGGDGTLTVANKLCKMGIPIVAVPKTIDNDVMETDITCGFDSAVTTATDAIDKIRTTAESHHRVMVIEVMGRYVGWLSLYAGIASGADIILIPEIPYDIGVIAKHILRRKEAGKSFSLVVVAEGAIPIDGNLVLREYVQDSHDPVRLGGIGDRVAKEISRLTGLESRITVLGHIQRGGSPTAFDRILATRLGSAAIEQVALGTYGVMVGIRGNVVVPVPIEAAVSQLKTVPPYCSLLGIARNLGTSFGSDEVAIPDRESLPLAKSA